MFKSLKAGLFFSAAVLGLACSSKAASTPAPPLVVGNDDDDTTAIDAATEPAQLVVFVTSTLYNGALGGLSGADTICQTRAAAANLSGTFRAWVSDPSGSPSTRFTHPTVNYQLVDGTLVAAGWSELASGQLRHAIDRTELGMAPPAASLEDGGASLADGGAIQGGPIAWTDTVADGTFNVSGDACNNWSGDVTFGATFGDPTATDSVWSLGGRLKAGYCMSAMASLYCVQQ